MAAAYSASLKLEYELCYSTLLKLQSNALEKLNQINRFKQNGLATVKIKILQQTVNTKIITKEVSLAALGADLKTLVHDEANIPFERLVKIN